jgi:hypothetical protein
MVNLTPYSATQEALLSQHILLLVAFCQVFRKLSSRLPWSSLTRHQKRRLDNAFRRLASDIALARIALGIGRSDTAKDAASREK